MTQAYIARMVREADELPTPTRDGLCYLRALLRQRARQRSLTPFERAMRKAVDAELSGATEIALAKLTLAAAMALRREMERAAP